jgi:hypothetical protein
MKYRIFSNGKTFRIKHSYLGMLWCWEMEAVDSIDNNPAYDILEFAEFIEARSWVAHAQAARNEKWEVVE